MDKIQTAGEVVSAIDDNCAVLGIWAKQAIYDLIRSRDRAIVERAFDFIKVDTGKAIIKCKEYTREQFVDSVIRELEGEEGKCRVGK